LSILKYIDSSLYFFSLIKFAFNGLPELQYLANASLTYDSSSDVYTGFVYLIWNMNSFEVNDDSIILNLSIPNTYFSLADLRILLAVKLNFF